MLSPFFFFYFFFFFWGFCLRKLAVDKRFHKSLKLFLRGHLWYIYLKFVFNKSISFAAISSEQNTKNIYDCL
jgi:hypothetical protein